MADVKGIPERPGEAINAIRAWYEAAMAAVATELRPRFESGELHGWREGDADRTKPGGTYVPPLWLVERTCGRIFIGESLERAYMVLLVSPSEPETFDAGTTDERYHAAEAMAHDVIRYARAQGWYSPTADEEHPAAEPAGRRSSAFAEWGWRDEDGGEVAP